MTIESNDHRYLYNGNGVSTVFNGPRAFAETDVKVYLITDGVPALVPTNDYTVTGVGRRNTRIEFNAAPAAGQQVLILRDVAYDQPTDLTNQGPFLPEIHEHAFDRQVMQIQQIADEVGRAFKLPETSTANVSFDVPEPEPLMLLGWNNTVTGLVNFPVPDVGTGTYQPGFPSSVPRLVANKLREVVSVRDFGAVGDGVTDDTSAFEAAILALDAAGGGTLLVPAATYVINGIVELRSNIHIAGDGAVIIKTAPSPYAVFAALSGAAQGYGASVRNVSATGLTFRGDFANNIGICGFALHHAQDVSISRCRFVEAIRGGHAIDMNGCDTVTVRDCVFEGFNPPSGGFYRAEAIQLDVSAAGAVSAADNADGFDGLLTRNVIIDGCQFLPLTIGMTTYPCPNPVGAHSTIEGQQYEGLRFTNNLIIDPIEDVATDDSETGAVKGVIHFPALKNAIIADNEFIMNENRCVRVISIYSMTIGIASTSDFSQTGLSTGPITPVLSQNITIRDNVFRGFSHRSGIPDQQTIFLRGLATAPVENIVVTGNKFEDGYRNEQNHTYLLGRYSDGVTFSDNTVTDCGTAIKSEGGSRWQAVGNTFIRCRAQPILVQDTDGFAIMSNTARVCGRGFRSQNASRNVTITGNTFSDSTDTGLQAAGIEVGGSTDNFTVSGNVVFYDGTETAGIAIGSGVSNGVVVGNMATGYTTKVSIAGTPPNVTAANNY